MSPRAGHRIAGSQQRGKAGDGENATAEGIKAGQSRARNRRGESGNTDSALEFLQDFSEHLEMICSKDRVSFQSRRILLLVDNCIPEHQVSLGLGNATRQRTAGKAAQRPLLREISTPESPR